MNDESKTIPDAVLELTGSLTQAELERLAKEIQRHQANGTGGLLIIDGVKEFHSGIKDIGKVNTDPQNG